MLKKVLLSSSILIPVVSTPLICSTVAFTNNTTNSKTKSKLSDSKINVLNEANYNNSNATTESTSKICANFNPKYIFAFYTDNLKFQKTTDGKYKASLDFGINMEYINAAVYGTSLYYGDESNAIRPLLYDYNGNKTYANIINDFNVKSDQATVYTQVAGLIGSIDDAHGEEAKNTWIELIWQALDSGFLYIAPTGGTEPSGTWNRSLTKYPNFIINDNTTGNYLNFWPNEQNLAWVVNKLVSEQAWKEINFPGWDTQGSKCYLDPANWSTYIQNFKNSQLKWKQIWSNYGFEKKYGKTGKEYQLSMSSIISRVEELLTQNIEDQNIILSSSITLPSYISTSFTINVQDIVQSKTHKKTIMTITFDNKDKADDFCESEFNNISLYASSGLHYYSAWYNDIFAVKYCTLSGDDRDEDNFTSQNNTWSKWKGTTYSYELPYQLYKTDDTSAQQYRTNTGCILSNYTPSTYGPCFTFEKPYGSSVDPFNPDDEVPPELKDGDGEIYIQGDTKSYTLVPTIQNASITAPDGKVYQLAFNIENFYTYLYTLKNTSFKSFFDSGLIDTTIYASDGTTTVNDLWGKVHCYKLNGSEKTQVPAKHFFFSASADSSTTIQGNLRDNLDSDIEENSNNYKCIIASDTSIYYEYSVSNIVNPETQTVKDSYTSSIIDGFSRAFTFKQTFNAFNGSTKVLYNQPKTFRDNYINFADNETTNKSALFNTNFKKSDIISHDFDKIYMIPEAYIYNNDSYKDKFLLFPSQWIDYCGMEEPTTDTQLTIHYKWVDRCLNRTFSTTYKNQIANLFLIPQIEECSATWTSCDYSISPMPVDSKFTYELYADESCTESTSLASIITPTSDNAVSIQANAAGTIYLKAIDTSSQEYNVKEISLVSDDTIYNSKNKHISNKESTNIKISGSENILVGTYSKYIVCKTSQVQHENDSFSYIYTFGSSYLSSNETPTFQLLFPFNDEETLENEEITNSDDVFNAFEITCAPKSSPTVTQTITSGSKIEIKEADYIITFKLKQEFLSRNCIKFNVGNVLVKDKTTNDTNVFNSSLGAAEVNQILDPIEKTPNVYGKESESRTSAQKDKECMIYQNETCSMSFKTSSLHKKYLINIDSTIFKLITSTSEINLTKKTLEQTDPNITIIELYVGDPEDETSELVYTVTFTQTEIQTNGTWVTAINIVQNWNPDIVGKLSMTYQNGLLASELTTEWAVGDETVTPGPISGDTDVSITKYSYFWSSAHILSLVAICTGSIGMVAGVFAIYKHKKSLKNKK